MSESKEVVESKGNALSTDVAMGIASEFTRDDVQQGRLMLMQAGSQLVKDEVARQGSIINIVDNEELAYKGNDKEQPKDLEFLICGILKYWVEKDGDTDEFLGKRPAVNANELPWEEFKDGRNIERTFHFSYMVLLPEEIEQGIEMPYELAFRSTAVKDTKKLNSIIAKLAQKKISSHDKVFKAKIVKRTKDKNEWWGLDLSVSRDSNESEKECVTNYFSEFTKYQEAVMNSGDDYGKTENTSSEETNTHVSADDY